MVHRLVWVWKIRDCCDLGEEALEMGANAFRLDGDNIRLGMHAGFVVPRSCCTYCGHRLGHSADDQVEGLRRVGEVSALFADSGVIVIVSSFVSRDKIRQMHMPQGLEFLEIFARVSPLTAESRDPQVLSAKASFWDNFKSLPTLQRLL
jgi:adenylylsulfate kinase